MPPRRRSGWWNLESERRTFQPAPPEETRARSRGKSGATARGTKRHRDPTRTQPVDSRRRPRRRPGRERRGDPWTGGCCLELERRAKGCDGRTAGRDARAGTGLRGSTTVLRRSRRLDLRAFVEQKYQSDGNRVGQPGAARSRVGQRSKPRGGTSGSNCRHVAGCRSVKAHFEHSPLWHRRPRRA